MIFGPPQTQGQVSTHEYISQPYAATWKAHKHCQ